MIIKNYTDFLTEKLDLEKLNNKFTEEYKDLKTDLLDYMNETLEETSDENVKNEDLIRFIDEYVSTGKESNSLDGLIEDNDVFNFYLKHQSDIDELLNKTEYLSKPPVDNNVFSLYDIIMDGTKEAFNSSFDNDIK